MTSFAARAATAAHRRLVEPLLALALKPRRLARFGLDPDAALPRIAVDPYRSESCAPSCAFEPGARSDVVARYVEQDATRPPARTRLTPMAVDLSRGLTMPEFERLLKKRSSRTLPKLRRAREAGYEARLFPLRAHVFDVHAVKTSLPSRTGGPVLDYWFLRPEHVGRPATGRIALKRPVCPNHWTMWWGAFVDAPGHRQGDVTVDRRLVAYVKATRRGDLLHYADLMGHRDHLGAGVMALIHLEIVRWLLEDDDPLGRGVKAVLYGAAEHGRDGLLTWKKRAGFEPARLVLERSPARPD